MATQKRPGDAVGVPVHPGDEDAAELLETGEIIGGRRIAWSSNHAFLVHVRAGRDGYVRAVYKPRDGERPLYDFPTGTLYRREYAAFVVSRALGWPRVPVTVMRDGPLGPGSMQLFVDSDPNVTYFELAGEGREGREELYELAVFDLLVNNADRKAGHCLMDADGAIWSIDHGLTFHSEFKVRTVMLDLWGSPFPRSLHQRLQAMAPELEAGGCLAERLSDVLLPEEIANLASRLESMLADPVLPRLDPYRNVPWPLV